MKVNLVKIKRKLGKSTRNTHWYNRNIEISFAYQIRIKTSAMHIYKYIHRAYEYYSNKEILNLKSFNHLG